MIKLYVASDQNVEHLPENLEDLRKISTKHQLSKDGLLESANWTELIDPVEVPKGWVQLGTMARTSRGIATGCNDFFLTSPKVIKEIGIQDHNTLPCIGKSLHVDKTVFKRSDYEELYESDLKVVLMSFSSSVNFSEKAYITEGQNSNICDRYLLKMRKPWYSMERKPIFPIWVSVFKRGGTRFIRNKAKVYSLTNFHGIVPNDERSVFHDALAAVLNCSSVLRISERSSRKFGGGLVKFEPKDLERIWLPDLRRASDEVLAQLATKLSILDTVERAGGSCTEVDQSIRTTLSKI